MGTMKLAFVVVGVVVAGRSFAIADDAPCMTLSWSGSGPGVSSVRAWFVSLDERSGKATIRYDHDGGEMSFNIVKRNDRRVELKGSWAQRDGRNGYATLMLDSDRKNAAGSWTYAGKPQQYELSLHVGGARCPAAPPRPAADPSCGIARSAAVYPGCGYVYQSRANQKKQCGGNDAPLKFIYNDTVKSSCGIRREQTVYSGCGHVYQRQSDWRAQCGQDGTAFKFIPRE